MSRLFLPVEKRASILLFLTVWYDKKNDVSNLIHFYAALTKSHFKDFLFFSFSEVKVRIV